ncbi:hypothetical protein N9Y23_02880 [Pseudomonadales bacterium]|nr:hypothetical protein [Pseudomonadales bacterium]
MQKSRKSSKHLEPVVLMAAIGVMVCITHYQIINVIGVLLGDVGKGLVMASLLSFQIKTHLPEHGEEKLKKIEWVLLYILMAAAFVGAFSLISWVFA